MPDDWLLAALLLLRLDLETLRPALLNLYSTSSRGRTPYDPVKMLRALLLMTCLGQEKITTFAQDLRAKPRLAAIAGFDHGFNCPVKRPTHQDGKIIWQSHAEQCPHKVLCQPETKMGPILYIRSESEPRLYPPIPRASPKFKELMKLRSGGERSNSVKQVAHKLGHRPCRSATHYPVRLYLVSIVEHAKAWLADDRKVLGEDWQALSDLEKIQQRGAPPPA